METKKYRFDEVTINFDKKRIPLSSAQREKRQGTFRYYGAQGVIDHVDDYIFDGTYLLIAEDGENLKSKKQNIAQVVDGQFWVNNHAHIVQGNEQCDTRFLCYLINSMDLSGYVTGSAQPKLSQANLNAVTLSLPTLAEQKRIVEYLYMLDQKIDVNRQINDNLANTEQAILVETVINNHTVPTALGDLVDFIDGDRGKNYPTFDEFTSTGYCLFLNASNVTSTGFNFDNCMFVSEEKDKLMNKGHLSPYDIVLTSRGTLGNVALYDKHIKYENVRINSGMLIIRPKTKRLSPYFIYALLKSSYMKAAIERFKSGSAQPQLPIKDLQKITFEIPESDTVLVALDRQFLAVEESISINNNEIGNLKELSNVLLAELSR